MFVSKLTMIGWGFLVMSWIIPYMMRKRATSFEQRQKSYSVGILLSAIALVFFACDMILFVTK